MGELSPLSLEKKTEVYELISSAIKQIHGYVFNCCLFYSCLACIALAGDYRVNLSKTHFVLKKIDHPSNFSRRWHKFVRFGTCDDVNSADEYGQFYADGEKYQLYYCDHTWAEGQGEVVDLHAGLLSKFYDHKAKKAFRWPFHQVTGCEGDFLWQSKDSLPEALMPFYQNSHSPHLDSDQLTEIKEMAKLLGHTVTTEDIYGLFAPTGNTGKDHQYHQ